MLCPGYLLLLESGQVLVFRRRTGRILRFALGIDDNLWTGFSSWARDRSLQLLNPVNRENTKPISCCLWRETYGWGEHGAVSGSSHIQSLSPNILLQTYENIAAGLSIDGLRIGDEYSMHNTKYSWWGTVMSGSLDRSLSSRDVLPLKLLRTSHLRKFAEAYSVSLWQTCQV